MKALSFLLLSVSLVGCADLTFAKQAALDYRQYRTVCISARSWSSYLQTEMGSSTGFAAVTVACSGDEDAVLSVSVSTESYDNSTDETTDIDYYGYADYELTDRDGQVIDSGSVKSDSETSDEAEQDVLDKVAFHYHAPYRL